MADIPDRTEIRRIQLRRDTAANWAFVNPVLTDGELGIERNTRKFKIGDGTTAWNDLEYGGLKGDADTSSFISEDDENRLTRGADGGLYVPQLMIDPLAYYILAKS